MRPAKTRHDRLPRKGDLVISDQLTRLRKGIYPRLGATSRIKITDCILVLILVLVAARAMTALFRA